MAAGSEMNESGDHLRNLFGNKWRNFIFQLTSPSYLVNNKYPNIPLWHEIDPLPSFDSKSAFNEIIVKNNNSYWTDIAYYFSYGHLIKSVRSGGIMSKNIETCKFNENSHLIEEIKEERDYNNDILKKEKLKIQYSYEDEKVAFLKGKRDYYQKDYEGVVKKSNLFEYYYYYYYYPSNDVILAVDYKNGNILRYLSKKNQLNQISSNEEQLITGQSINKKSFDYNKKLFTKSINDPGYNRSEYEYDSEGRLTKSLYFHKFSVKSKPSNIFTYKYWMPRTHFLSYESHIIPFAAPDEYETIYKYDAFYNLVEQELRLYTDGNLNRYKGEKYEYSNEYRGDLLINCIKKMLDIHFGNVQSTESIHYEYL
jgi:hypothetical protein|tara:strand:+ start:487 stop:1587 length:1101 start_codon:yes stop_codon:yes gene_type:complete